MDEFPIVDRVVEGRKRGRHHHREKKKHREVGEDYQDKGEGKTKDKADDMKQKHSGGVKDVPISVPEVDNLIDRMNNLNDGFG